VEETPRWTNVIIYKDACTQTFRNPHLENINTMPYNRVYSRAAMRAQPMQKRKMPKGFYL